ncbi:hypothetical protein [Burkholderia glumae]|uniref:hypothetical protein n=1 Tax=Burkholderia glumae TaxID=337 RepID=UPI0002D5AFF3|nr:hypothetical protein [Burkholderia glumae]MCM2494836.1 hypothetical protein [Burkholderia glumae]MCM2545701.1 hypothetical protein [Burkholderia glumae]
MEALGMLSFLNQSESTKDLYDRKKLYNCAPFACRISSRNLSIIQQTKTRHRGPKVDRPQHREIEAGSAGALPIARNVPPRLPPARVDDTVFSGGIGPFLDHYLRSRRDEIGTLLQAQALHAKQPVPSPAARGTSNARNGLLSIRYRKIREPIRRSLESPGLMPDRSCKEIGMSRSKRPIAGDA